MVFYAEKTRLPVDLLLSRAPFINPQAQKFANKIKKASSVD